jgi:hypothetical protein
MKYAFVRDRQVAFPLVTMCKVLSISTSGFYDWLKAPPSVRAKSDAVLSVHVPRRASEESWGLR